MLLGPGQPLPRSFPEGMGVRREGAKGAQAARRNGPHLAGLVVAASATAAPSGRGGGPLGALGRAQAAECLPGFRPPLYGTARGRGSARHTAGDPQPWGADTGQPERGKGGGGVLLDGGARQSAAGLVPYTLGPP